MLPYALTLPSGAIVTIREDGYQLSKDGVVVSEYNEPVHEYERAVCNMVERFKDVLTIEDVDYLMAEVEQSISSDEIPISLKAGVWLMRVIMVVGVLLSILILRRSS